MPRIRQAVFALGLCLAASPALAAWGTPTKLNTTLNWNHATAAHSVSLTTNVAVPAGAIIILGGGARGLNAAGDAMPFVDSAGDTFTSVKCQNTTTTTDGEAIGFAESTAGLASGGTVTVSDTSTGGTDATDLQIVGMFITGGVSSSPEDVAVRACQASSTATTSPTVTSNAGAFDGDLLFSMFSNGNGSGFSFTEDAAWSALTAASDSDVGVASATKINAGAGAVTRTGTSSNENYAMGIIGLEVAGAVTTPKSIMFGPVP